MRKRRFWGWGYADEEVDAGHLAAIEAGLGHFLGLTGLTRRRPPAIGEITLRRPRATVPSSLASLTSAEPFDRALHAYGRSYRDLVRAIDGCFENPPDLVLYPEDEADVVRVLDWCDGARLAVIPFGGGSSVSGGVEPDPDGTHAGAVTLDLGRLGRVLEVDAVSRAARIQAGALGPALEAGLKPHGFTLRHFPQSFEFSSLGGWIATRAGGHYATLYTHVDDLVESLRVVTPTGILETRRLPGSGAGPSPDRLFLGSEGTLGVITEAWMRVQRRPRFRASFAALFPSFEAGARAVRALAQSGLHPSNARLLDPFEALMTGAGSGDRAVLLAGFESADHSLDAPIRRAAELCRDGGGEVPDAAIRTRTEGAGEREGAGGTWRDAFLRAPYLRDELLLRGVFTETFETAVTWDRFDALHGAVHAAASGAASALGVRAIVTCRITHAYPDGAAPYFTVIAGSVKGEELAQWGAFKRAITDAMLDHGGTTTHHHAVGRDFRPWYEREVPEAFRRVLRAAKAELDPRGILNPGVLFLGGS